MYPCVHDSHKTNYGLLKVIVTVNNLHSTSSTTIFISQTNIFIIRSLSRSTYTFKLKDFIAIKKVLDLSYLYSLASSVQLWSKIQVRADVHFWCLPSLFTDKGQICIFLTCITLMLFFNDLFIDTYFCRFIQKAYICCEM